MSPRAASRRRTSAASLAGAAVSALVVVLLLADAAVGVFAPGKLAADMAATGFPRALGLPISATAFVCAVVYAVPRTCVLGAILVTGFLGGAICTHFRIGEVGSPPQIVSLLLGALAWLGLYLRDARVRALLPITSRGF